MLAVAAREKLHLRQFDIKTAFLYGELSEEIIMRQPEGFSDGTDKVCKLLKSLYGLKQAPRCWNIKFSSVLSKFGLHESDSDACLYIGNVANQRMFLVLYVDDGLIICQRSEVPDRFISKLKQEFKVTVSDSSCYLGLID